MEFIDDTDWIGGEEIAQEVVAQDNS